MLTTTLFRTLINDYSKTENINIDTFDRYLINLNLYDEFLDHNVNLVKGFVFEHITKYIYLNKNFEVYLFNEIPSDIRKLFNLGMKDKGIDLLFKDTNKWTAVQIKWRTKTNLCINKNEILGFIEEAKRHNLNEEMIVVTNVKNINKYISEEYDLEWVLRKNLREIINREFINFIINEIQFKPIIQKQEKFILRNCQKNALKALNNSKSSRKQCIMFCGTGKSIVMIEYIRLKKSNRIVVLMPSLQLISQFYNNLKQYIKRDILCICSKFDKSSLTGDETGDETGDKEGDTLLIEYLNSEAKNIKYTTKPNIIAQRLKQDKLIVLCTYQSSQLLKNSKFDLGLFDEAHKTVNSDSFGFTLHDENCLINERVFFTATPKYYKGNDEMCISMCNEQIYGKEVFNYPYSQAKDDGYVLDFQILTYIVPENMEDIINENYIKQDNLNVKSEVLISALILAQHIKNNIDSKKILTYHNTIDNAVEYKKTLAYVFLKYDINAKIFTMCGNTSMAKRNEIFNEYESSELAIICSSRVLNEGVDLPCTDTIVFVDPRSSTIDVTQCFGRADRIYGNQKICSIIIPIHYDHLDGKHKYSDTIKILSAMGEVDNKLIANFVNGGEGGKIRMVNMNIDCIVGDEVDVKYDFGEVIRDLRLAIVESRVLGFEYKMNLLFRYCDENKCAPRQRTKYENQNIGSWLQNQKSKINSINDELYIILSVNEYMKPDLDEYLKNFEKNKDKEKLSWNEWAQLLFKYCNENKCCAQSNTKYESFNIGMWLHHQKKKINNIEDEVYIKLSVNKYVKNNLDNYLKNVEKNKDKLILEWNQWQELLFKYCNENKCCAQSNTKYKTRNIGSWLQDQKKKINSINDEVYKKLSVNKYVKKNLDEYLNPDNKWYEWLQLLFKYCDENKCSPPSRMNYENHNIGAWLSNQKVKINSVNDDLYIKLSVNEYVKKSLDEYLKYIEENKDKDKLGWTQWQQLLFKYCNENECAPLRRIKYENYNIGSWLQDQKKKINSVNDDIYIKLSINEYIKKNLDEYLNPDSKWNDWQELLFEYCDENKYTPQQKTKYENQNIGGWLGTQKKQISSVDDEIYIKLSTNKYVKKNLDDYLKYIEETKDKKKLEWNEWQHLLFKYCDENKCVPQHKTKYEEHNIGSWLQHQKEKINNNNDDIYTKLSTNEYIKKNLDTYLQNKNK